MPVWHWRISSASGATTQGTLLETAPCQLLMLEPEVVVEVAEVVDVEAPELSWLQWMHAEVCKVHSFTMVYPAGYYLIPVHLILSYLDSFA